MTQPMDPNVLAMLQAAAGQQTQAQPAPIGVAAGVPGAPAQYAPGPVQPAASAPAQAPAQVPAQAPAQAPAQVPAQAFYQAPQQYALPSLDDRQVADFSSGPPFVPWGDWRAVFTLDSLKHKEGRKGLAFVATVTCAAFHGGSPTNGTLVPGGKYTFRFAYDPMVFQYPDPKKHPEYTKTMSALNQLRGMVAAIFGKDSQDPAFKGQGDIARAQLLQESESRPNLGYPFEAAASSRTTKAGGQFTVYSFSPVQQQA